MGKKAVIVISLVEESDEKPNRKIEKEIMRELTAEPSRIPWLKKVEKVTRLCEMATQISKKGI